MRVFVDTNVLLSALLSRGVCAELVARLAAGHQPVISRYVDLETARVLREKFSADDAQVREALALFAGWEHVDDVEDPPAVTRDPADDPILAAAAAAHADVLLTGDRDLTELSEADRPMPILTPRKLLDFLNRGSGGAEPAG